MPSPATPEDVGATRSAPRIHLRDVLMPNPLPGLALPGLPANFWQAREQLLTLLLRAEALFGLLTFLLTAATLYNARLYSLIVLQSFILALIGCLALWRGLDYRVRAGVVLAGIYLLGLNELLNFGYSEDAHAFLFAFALSGLLFFDWKIGAVALALTILSLVAVGELFVLGLFSPISGALRPLSHSSVLTTCLVFILTVGSMQVGVAVLLRHLQAAWQLEAAARADLERRVAERTAALAQAHAQALAASRYEAEQKEFLTLLHQTTLELLDRRTLADLLQAVVDRAAIVLDAPYGELLLREGDELAVQAFTANQAFLAGDRVSRSQARLSWQAYDTHQPAVLEDYSAWASHRSIYDAIGLRAVADFPILIGSECLGVLAMGRTRPGQHFTADDVRKGMAFSHLAALVLDNANLYATALHEIAERKQAELALQNHNAELDAFAYMVAHDLKTPLTGLIGYNEILQTDYATLSGAEVQGFLADIARLSDKMAAIINDFMLLANVRARRDIPLGPVPMTAIVAAVLEHQAPLIAATGATVALPDAWPETIGYAPWVEQIWDNYLSNALKYGGSAPRVTLGADRAAGGMVRFWVRDSGPGIAPDDLKKLFVPFSRLYASPSEGHGLGLAIVQRVVDKLGGTAGVESAPGHGSLFYFTLPAAGP